MSQEQRSKYLSFLLRHKPEAANLTMDKEGWVQVEQILQNTDFTTAELHQIVADDQKGRYSFSSVASSIRANQGHSAAGVKLLFKKAVPPTILYHGTAESALSEIMKHGLLPMKRHHVHLSADLETAKSVGGRRKGGFVVLEIDAKTMLANGYKFFISDNHVWLVDLVPPIFLKVSTS